MSAILLSAHIIVAILAVGPITVAARMFPRYERDESARPVTNALYRICQTYAVVGVAVPLLGIATAISMGVLTQAWDQACHDDGHLQSAVGGRHGLDDRAPGFDDRRLMVSWLYVRLWATLSLNR